MSRDSDRSGCVRSAASSAPSNGATCACAHAQALARSGSSSRGTAGRSIVSTGSGRLALTVSVTPCCRRTTIRHTQGRKRFWAFADAGVKSHGKSGRSKSMQARKLGSKARAAGAGSVRMT
jgi:hypothetical protein